MSQAQEETLPLLREDLELKEMAPDDDGFPVWLIYDQAAHRYFVIGWLEFEVLVRWSLGSAKKIVESVNKETTLHIATQNIEFIKNFLVQNELVKATNHEHIFHLIHKKRDKSIFKTALHSYLFFLIPLVSPDRFLSKTLPFVKIFFTKAFLTIILILAFLGFYLIARQWDEFIHTFSYFFTFQNMLVFVLAIIIVKIFHELGHAYVAKYNGCRVSTIGVAFLVMWPVLYTDTTDVWKLNSKKQRIAVALAGIGTELVLAVIATFLWTFMPEGIGKSIVFFVATISWISSVLININPLLRFDGYYFFADLIGVDNLQSTAFTIGKWKLREWLFKFGEKAPIIYPKKKEKLLVFYAYFTWIYRFFLFLSIAILVYYFFFKVLGIILMIVEILYFILLPILGELKNYWIRRKSIAMNKNTLITFSVIILLLALFFIPWSTQISAPATLEYTKQTKVFIDHDGKIESIHYKNGSFVKQGQILLSLESPTLNYEMKKTHIEIQETQTRLRQEIDRTRELGYQTASFQDLESLENKLENLKEEQQKLVIKAPFDGIMFSNNQGLKKGVWLGKNFLLGDLVNVQSPVVYAYITENNLHRISLNSTAKFYPNEVDNNTVKLKVVEIDEAATDELASPYLASVYGGDIAVTPDKSQNQNKLQVNEALYRVKLLPTQQEPLLTHIVTGKVVIEGKKQSYAHRLWLAISAVLIRESGF